VSTLITSGEAPKWASDILEEILEEIGTETDHKYDCKLAWDENESLAEIHSGIKEDGVDANLLISFCQTFADVKGVRQDDDGYFVITIAR